MYAHIQPGVYERVSYQQCMLRGIVSMQASHHMYTPSYAPPHTPTSQLGLLLVVRLLVLSRLLCRRAPRALALGLGGRLALLFHHHLFLDCLHWGAQEESSKHTNMHTPKSDDGGVGGRM